MKKIVAFSDWHDGGVNALKKFDNVMFPEGDLLAFAGDATGQCSPFSKMSQIKQIKEFILLTLLEVSDRYEYIVCVFGNHDTSFDKNIKEDLGNFGKKFSKNNLEEFKSIVKEFNEKSKKAKLLWSEKEEVYNLEFEDGEKLSIFATPYTHQIWDKDPWGFHFEDSIDFVKWKEYGDVKYDIVISHSPIIGYGDKTDGYSHVGTSYFDNWKYKPEAFISGHIHEAYGVYEGINDWEGTTFLSCSLCNRDYIALNDMMEFLIVKDESNEDNK